MARKGGPARGRGGHTGGNPGKEREREKDRDRVAKPAVTKTDLLKPLLPTVRSEGVPTAIIESLTEFSHAQPFFSALERLDPELATYSRMSSCWLGVPGDQIQSLKRDDEKDEKFFGSLQFTNGSEVPVFIKRIHIMDPIATIEGECIWPQEGALPAPRELWANTLEKINEPMNEAYVDSVFAMIADRLVATGTSPHWCRCYGTFPARVERYMYNISDEYPSMRRKHFWKKGQATNVFSHVVQESENETHTHRVQPKIVFSEDQELNAADFVEEEEWEGVEDVEDVDVDVVDVVEDSDSEPTSSTDADIEAEEVGSVSDLKLAVPKIRLKKLSGSNTSSSSESSESSEEDDYYEHFAEFNNYPVQVTLLERAEGTLDELLEEEDMITAEREDCWKAWMFQVIAGLNIAQHFFGFVHNDLHTNNVMWSKTDKEFLYYRIHKGTQTYVMRAPTHGYIMKIIDFGRASFWLPEPAGFFISDAFFPGSDACNQYNCEPFFDSRNGKKVEPNPSFDLSRLSVSLLEGLYPKRPENATPIKFMSREGNKTYAETVSPLYNLLWEWITDDKGANILRLPNGEERYPDFDLYSAIAADVHKAVPAHQIEKPLFSEYKYTATVASEEPVYDLWIR